jgi:hypothetical protein
MNGNPVFKLKITLHPNDKLTLGINVFSTPFYISQENKVSGQCWGMCDAAQTAPVNVAHDIELGGA